jgi:drug/metabolite transporter (DMT)-like permease
MPSTRPRADAAASALGAAALWGGMYVVSKDTFDRVPPITLGALRLLVAGAALALILLLRGRLRWPGDRRIAVAGALLAFTLVLQFLGTDLATASEGALLTTTTPLAIVPLAWLFLGERPEWRTVAGIAVGMVGVALAVGAGSGFQRSVAGPLLLLGSAVGWASYTIASAPVARREGPLVAVTWGTLAALPLVGLLSTLEAGRWSGRAFTEPSTLAAIGYLGLAASAGAWYLWNRGVAGLPAAVTGAFFFVQPVVGGLLARAFLGESLGIGFVVGGGLILAGVLLALTGSADRKGPARHLAPTRKERP